MLEKIIEIKIDLDEKNVSESNKVNLIIILTVLE